MDIESIPRLCSTVWEQLKRLGYKRPRQFDRQHFLAASRRQLGDWGLELQGGVL